MHINVLDFMVSSSVIFLGLGRSTRRAKERRLQREMLRAACSLKPAHIMLPPHGHFQGVGAENCDTWLRAVREFLRIGRAATSEQTFGWRKLYEAAILEIVPDKLAIRIVAAEQAIAQRESLVDSTELERHKLADARSMLKTLSRIALP